MDTYYLEKKTSNIEILDRLYSIVNEGNTFLKPLAEAEGAEAEARAGAGAEAGAGAGARGEAKAVEAKAEAKAVEAEAGAGGGAKKVCSNCQVPYGCLCICNTCGKLEHITESEDARGVKCICGYSRVFCWHRVKDLCDCDPLPGWSFCSGCRLKHIEGSHVCFLTCSRCGESIGHKCICDYYSNLTTNR